MRKYIPLFLLLLFLFGCPSHAQFADIQSDSPLSAPLNLLIDEGILQARSGTSFNPDTPITRNEFSVMLYRTLKKIIKIPPTSAETMKRNFRDVKPKSFAYEAVSRLYKAGVLSKTNSGYFRGGQKISRYEMYSAFAKALKKTPIYGAENLSTTEAYMYPDVPIEHWAYPHLAALIKRGFLPQPENFQDFFKGENYATRKEGAVLVYFAVKKIVESRSIVASEEEESAQAGSKIFKDVPEGNFAYQDIQELIETKILSYSTGAEFGGEKAADRFKAMELLARIIEKVLSGDTELRQAGYDLKYRDISVLNPAYPAIQKLIELGLLAPGNNQESFNGTQVINRYQMACIFYNPMEDILAGSISIKEADQDLMYKDVPKDHFAAKVILKLINLGVLEGGSENKFEGGQKVTRYEMAHFVAKLLKGVYREVKEKGEITQQQFQSYGFDFSLSSTLRYLNTANGKSAGRDLSCASASELGSVAFNQNIGDNIKGYLNLRTYYYFGQAGTCYPYLYQGYTIINGGRFVVQAGRMSYYETFDPFGNSLFADALSDMILVEGETVLGRTTAALGKLIYQGDNQLDSNAAMLFASPTTSFLLPVQWNIGTSLITKPRDPSGLLASGQLDCRVSELYAGARFPLFNSLTGNVEIASASYTNEDAVLPYVGFSGEVDKSAYQAGLTYYSPDYKYQISLGYQKIGDDFYMAQLINPSVLVGGGQGTKSWLVKFRNYLSPQEYFGVDVENIFRDQENTTNRFYLLYNRKLFNQTYALFNFLRTEDKTAAGQNSWDITASLSSYF